MSSLKRNIFYQTMYQILIIILPLFTAPYVARVLGVENSGIYSYTHVTANYFFVFGMLGLEQYGARCIARVRANYDELCVVFSELLLVHILVSLTAIVSYFVYCIFFVNNYRFLFLLQGFFVFSVLFDVNWFFFGIEKFKLTVTRNTIIKLVSVTAIFLFVKSKEDLGIYSFILSFSGLLTQIVIWPLLNRYVSFRPVPLSSLKKHWLPMVVLFIAVLSANVNRMINQTMLGWFDKIEELGCYTYADKITRIPLSFIAAIDTVMLSKMSNLFAKKDKSEAKELLDISACLILLVSFGMGFTIAAIAPEFVVWYLGIEYAETAYLLNILAFSIPLVGWNNFVRTQILIPRQMDQVYSRAVCIGAVANVIINYFVIQIMGARGTAFVTIVSYGIILLLQTIPVIYVENDIKEYVKHAVFPIIAGIIMYTAVRFSAGVSNRLFISICLEILIAILVYGSMSVVYLGLKKPMLLKAILKK